MVIGIIVTFGATWKRNIDYDRDLVEARRRMKELGISVEEADREFEELQRGGQEEKETEGFLDIALKEGQKIREAKDNKIWADNLIYEQIDGIQQ